jgi:hypothetical protein
MPTQACDLAAAFAPFDPGPYPLGGRLALNRRPAGMSTSLGAWTYSRAARMGATIAGCARLRRLDREAATMPPRRAGAGFRTRGAAAWPPGLGIPPGSGALGPPDSGPAWGAEGAATRATSGGRKALGAACGSGPAPAGVKSWPPAQHGLAGPRLLPVRGRSHAADGLTAGRGRFKPCQGWPASASDAARRVGIDGGGATAAWAHPGRRGTGTRRHWPRIVCTG